MTDSADLDPQSLTRNAIQLMARGSLEEFRAVYHPDAVNREAKAEPPPCRRPGPDGFYATALWLRAAFDGIVFDCEHVVTEGDLSVAHVQMSGRHTGTMVTYRPDGHVDRAFAASGRSFRAPQAHFLRFREGSVIEHWAVRDDLGQALQLGWMPPSPRYLMRCAVATAAARRRLTAQRG